MKNIIPLTYRILIKFIRILVTYSFLLFAFTNTSFGQYSLTGTSYSQDFSGLGTSTNTNVLNGSLNNVAGTLNGWYFSETGTGANTTITSGTGSSNTGDTYNFGLTSDADRTLGGLLSGSLVPYFGFYFRNNTGSTITSLTVTYTGETWRVGTASRIDRLDFQYSYDATSPVTGTWADADVLDYQNAGSATTSGSATQIQTITNTISGLNITDNSTFFIRWKDLDATSADDGMGIDDFSFTTSGTGASPTISIAAQQPSGANISPGSAANIIALYKLIATNGNITPQQFTFTTAGSFLSSDIANFKVYQNSLASLSGATQVGSTYTGLSNGGSFVPATGFSAITAGNTSYFLITADVQSSPTNGRTVNITTTPLSNFVFTTTPVVTGTNPATVGNTFTVNTSTFTSGKLAVLSVAGTSSAAQTTSILQYNTSGTGQTGLTTVTFPSGASGTRLTQSGTATSEGDLSLSTNGSYLVCVGYDAAAGTASVATGSANGIVGRVASDGAFDISTSFNRSAATFITNNIRSACSDDGTRFWASGAGGSSGGVWYIVKGATSGTQLSTSLTTTRTVNIYNGQLYVTANSGSLRLATIGSGIPTTGTSQTITNLPGFLTTTGEPYAYVFFDRDASVSGVDLLYCVSLNGSAPSGILKYSFNGTTWTARGSVTGTIRGITASLNCSGYADLYVTLSASAGVRPSTLYKFTDQAAYNANITSNGSAITSVGTLLATAAGGTLFGGVAFTPMPDITAASNQTLTAGTYRNITVNSGATVTLAGDITVLGDVVVNSGGILDCSSFHLLNNNDFRSTFTLNSGGTIRTADPNGITASASSGAVQTCATRSYNAGANYAYTGTAAQSTGDGLPSTVTGSVTINNTGGVGDNIVTLTTAGSTFATLILTAGYLSIGPGNTLNISSGGTISGTGGDFATGTAGGTLNFPGTGTFATTNPLNPYNVYLSGGVNFGTSTNINGTLRINTSGFVNTNAPSYASGSLLQYNTTGTYGRSTEWSAISGAGYPYNVQVSNNTTLNYPNGSVAARNMEGSLTIDNGSALYMDYGNLLNNNQPLTVTGNITINGSFSLGDAAGGDLYLGRNWTRGSGGSFSPNNRGVYFGGGGTETITVTGGGTETFYILGVSKSGNNLRLSSSPATNVIVNGSSGDLLQLLGSAGGIDLNGQTLTLSGAGGNILTTTASHTITGIAGSTFTISGTKTVTSSLAGTLIFDANVLLTSSTGIDFGNNLTTINGTFQIDGGAFVTNNSPIYGTGSLLKYNANTTYNRTLEWGAASGAGYPYNVQLSNNTILVPGGTSNTGIALNTANDLTIDASSALYMDFGSVDMTVPLTVGNDLTINGNLSASDIAGGDINVKGNWLYNTGAVFSPKTRGVYFGGVAPQSIGGTQNSIFDYVINSNVTADVTMNKDVTVNQKLTLQTGGVLAINGNTLTLTSSIDNTTGNAGSFRGSSASNLSFTGIGQAGTLIFAATGQTLNALTVNRTGITNNYAVIMGSDLTVNTLTLSSGILATGNNLLASNTTGASTLNTGSFVATCDAAGTPLQQFANVPFTGSVGFRINNAGNTDTYFPVGATFTGLSPTPNRMMINNSYTAQSFTVVVNKGDIGGTSGARVNRIWYVKAALDTATVNMKLYFTERITANYGSTHDEVESGFDYSDLRILQKDYSNNPNFISISSNGDIRNVLPFSDGSETYGQYTAGAGNSVDFLGRTIGLSEFNRFTIANKGNAILPVNITNLRAWLQNNAAALSWTSVSENNIDHYVIERSVNGISFTAIGTETALNNGSLKTDYAFTDLYPQSGNNYYRLKVLEKDGHFSYTNIILITTAGGNIKITIMPNPVINGNVTVQFVNGDAGKYNLVLYSAKAEKVWQNNIEHLGGSAGYTALLPLSLAKGIYYMRIENTIFKTVQKIVVQ